MCQPGVAEQIPLPLAGSGIATRFIGISGNCIVVDIRKVFGTEDFLASEYVTHGNNMLVVPNNSGGNVSATPISKADLL